MTDLFHLWGFDGELKGNEERIQARLPMFTRKGSDEVFLAKKLDWSPELSASDVDRMTPEEAGEAGERLDLAGAAPPVVPRQYVAVTGPVFGRRLQSVGIMWAGIAVQAGFSIQLISAVKFDICTLLMESSAKLQFDAAIATGEVSAAAREALGVIQNVGIDNTRPQLVRTLAMHFLAGETDQFLRVLRLGAKSLKDDPERLKQEMHEHLQFVQASPAVETPSRTVRGTRFTSGPAVEKADMERTVRVIRATLERAKSAHPIIYGRRRGEDPDQKRKTRNISLSDLVKRVDSKKLTDWIVSEEQAES